MSKPTRNLTRRQQSSVLYGMRLTGEVTMPGWTMQLDHGEMVRAVERLEGQLVLSVCESGLSIWSAAGRVEVPGAGFWASPLMVAAARLRRALACDYGCAHLEFVDGKLSVNASSIPAREI